MNLAENQENFYHDNVVLIFMAIFETLPDNFKTKEYQHLQNTSHSKIIIDPYIANINLQTSKTARIIRKKVEKTTKRKYGWNMKGTVLDKKRVLTSDFLMIPSHNEA